LFHYWRESQLKVVGWLLTLTGITWVGMFLLQYDYLLKKLGRFLVVPLTGMYAT